MIEKCTASDLTTMVKAYSDDSQSITESKVIKVLQT